MAKFLVTLLFVLATIIQYNLADVTTPTITTTTATANNNTSGEPTNIVVTTNGTLVDIITTTTATTTTTTTANEDISTIVINTPVPSNDSSTNTATIASDNADYGHYPEAIESHESTATTLATNDSPSMVEDNQDQEDLAQEDTNNKYANLTQEEQSLGRLKDFLTDTVSQGLKSVLPTIVQTGLEANISASCTNSFMVLMAALQQGKDWAFRSKYLYELIYIQ